MTVTEVPVPEAFCITVSFDDARWALRVAGDVDVATGAQLEEVGSLLVERSAGAVEIDIGGVEFIDSAGLHALARTCRTIRAGGGRPALTGTASPALCRLVDALARSGVAVDLSLADPLLGLAAI